MLECEAIKLKSSGMVILNVLLERNDLNLFWVFQLLFSPSFFIFYHYGEIMTHLCSKNGLTTVQDLEVPQTEAEGFVVTVTWLYDACM